MGLCEMGELCCHVRPEKQKESMHPETATFAFFPHFGPSCLNITNPEAYFAATGLHRFSYRGCRDDTGGSQTVWMADPVSGLRLHTPDLRSHGPNSSGHKRHPPPRSWSVRMGIS